MPYDDVQQVCLRGHQITGSYDSKPDERKPFCDVCGEPTINACQECGTKIRGHHYYPDRPTHHRQVSVPNHCERCGKPFPWKDLVESLEPSLAGSLDRLERLCGQFQRIIRPLVKRRKNHRPFEINDEYDVQDLLHTLLMVFFDDIRDEEFSPSCAGMNAKIDFLLLNEQIAVEVKIARDKSSEARIGEELILDVAKYREHPNCKVLFCFVYDPDHQVKNFAGLRKDVEKQGGDLLVKVIVAPE